MKKIPAIDWDRMLKITQRLEFFRKFSVPEQRRFLGLRSGLYTYEKDEFLIRDGDDDTHLYILLKGSVRVCKGNKGEPFANLQAGDFFGEIAFLNHERRTADVIANEQCIALRLTSDMLGNLDVDIREKFKDKVIQKLIQRLDNMNNAFVNRWS